MAFLNNGNNKQVSKQQKTIAAFCIRTDYLCDSMMCKPVILTQEKGGMYEASRKTVKLFNDRSNIRQQYDVGSVQSQPNAANYRRCSQCNDDDQSDGITLRENSAQ
jgi:hypothetical protein